jgi:hypothetical protein
MSSGHVERPVLEINHFSSHSFQLNQQNLNSDYDPTEEAVQRETRVEVGEEKGTRDRGVRNDVLRGDICGHPL